MSRLTITGSANTTRTLDEIRHGYIESARSVNPDADLIKIEITWTRNLRLVVKAEFTTASDGPTQ